SAPAPHQNPRRSVRVSPDIRHPPGYFSRKRSASPQRVGARFPPSKPAAATSPTPEHPLATAPPRLLRRLSQGTMAAFLSTTSSTLRPVVGTKIRSVLPTSLSATFGLIWISLSQSTGPPSAHAVRT